MTMKHRVITIVHIAKIIVPLVNRSLVMRRGFLGSIGMVMHSRL